MGRFIRFQSAAQDICLVAAVLVMAAGLGLSAARLGFDFGASPQTSRDWTPRQANIIHASVPVVPTGARKMFSGYDVPRDAQLLAPAPAPSRERFSGEGGGRAHVGSVSSTRGVDHSDVRVHLLEATTRLWDRAGLAQGQASEAHAQAVAFNN